MRNILYLTLFLILLIYGCKKDHTSSGSSTPSNTIIATYNGRTITQPLQHTIGLYLGQTVQLTSTSGSPISISIGRCSSSPNFVSGTYNFCYYSCTNGSNYMALTDDSTGQSYASSDFGTITISFSSNVCTGTFNTTLSNGTTSIPVTGSFNESY